MNIAKEPVSPAPGATTSDKDYLPPTHLIKYLLDFGFQRHRGTEKRGDLEINFLDLTPLKLNVGHFTPFVTCKALSGYKAITAEHLDPVIAEVQSFAKQQDTYFYVLVIGGKLIYDRKKRFQNIGRHKIAVIDLNALVAIYSAPDQETTYRALVSPLVDFLGRNRLSPYQPRQLATGGRFFGRAESLRTALSSDHGHNVTFAGNRRIGKTSLLQEIKRQIVRDDSSVAIADVYGNTCNNTYSLLYKILLDLRPELSSQALMEESLLIEKFPSMVHAIPKSDNRNVAVFIDELDHILEFDEGQGFVVLEILRSVFQHDRCRVFCAGFRRTIDATLRDDHPLRNFTHPHRLTGLSLNETVEMVTKPLSLLQIDVPPSMAVAIEKETAGHPELVQICCDAIIRHREANDKSPTPGELLSEVFDGDIFKQTVLGAFLTNFNPYEQLSCYLLFRRAKKEFDRYEFSLSEINDELKSEKITLPLKFLNTLANNLHVGGAITPIRGSMTRYRFSVPQLARYCISLDLDFCIRKAIEELAEYKGEIEAVLNAPEATTAQSAGR